MNKENIDITILLGVEADIDNIELLYNEINDFLAKGINYSGWKKGVYPIREDAIKGISEGNLFIAKYQDEIVGTVILNHEPEEAYYNAKWKIDDNYNEIIVLRTFVVNPNYLRLGIGKKVMDFAYNFAKENNMKSIRLDVYEKNEPAIKLYEKCGYEYIDTVDLGLSNYGLNYFRLYEKLI